jgi:hypothetical protein
MSDTGAILWTPHRKMKEAGALPVKVRTADGVLVGSGVSGTPISVPPGAYHVCIVMPDGKEHAARTLTKVSVGETVAPRIALPDEDMRAQMVSRAKAIAFETKAIEGGTVTARQWQGTWLGEWASPQEALMSGLLEEEKLLSESQQSLLFADDAHDRFLITTHKRASDGHDILRFTIVPHDECLACVDDGPDARAILASIREGSDPPAIKYASPTSQETNALLNFVDAGVLGEMQTVTSAFINEGETAMLQTRMSLLRGLTGAYVMLRANALDGMGPWLKQLGEMAPFLPDTYTLQAELLARAGRHEEAVLALRGAMGALCPWFRAGVSYLLERLRLYTELDEETKATLGLSPEDWATFGRARKRLERMAPMLVVSQIFTTFDIPK